MAKKSKNKSKNKSKSKKRKKSKTKKMSGKSTVFMVSGIAMAFLFLPTTFFLFVGMLLTPLALLVDRTRQKTKMMAVGSMNLAGCSPFLFNLWSHGNEFEYAFDIVTNVESMIIIYTAAGMGYGINWVMTSTVATTLYERWKKRQIAIKKRQEELVTRWGPSVTGDMPLDPDGFPIDPK